MRKLLHMHYGSEGLRRQCNVVSVAQTSGFKPILASFREGTTHEPRLGGICYCVNFSDVCVYDQRSTLTKVDTQQHAPGQHAKQQVLSCC
jgi:hypothetical protein